MSQMAATRSDAAAQAAAETQAGPPTGIDEVLTTTRAVRRRLDLDRPVPREVIEDCLQLAVHAPNAENKQTWRWLVVTDPAKRQVIADYYRMAWHGRGFMNDGRRRPRRDDPWAGERSRSSGLWLVENLERVPVHVIPCVLGRPPEPEEIRRLERTWGAVEDAPPPRMRAGLVGYGTFFGSIFPAIWSFQLALRSRGLGSTVITAHLAFAEFLAEELGIPRQVSQIALLPVGYTRGLQFRPPPRTPARDLTVWNDWGRPRAGAELRKALLEEGQSRLEEEW